MSEAETSCCWRRRRRRRWRLVSVRRQVLTVFLSLAFSLTLALSMSMLPPASPRLRPDFPPLGTDFALLGADFSPKAPPDSPETTQPQPPPPPPPQPADGDLTNQAADGLDQSQQADDNNNNGPEESADDRPEVAPLANDELQDAERQPDDESNGPANGGGLVNGSLEGARSDPNNASICAQMVPIVQHTSWSLSLVYYVCYGLLFVLGLAGNSLTICAMWKKREKTVTDMFIVSLAISDVLVCTFTIPITPIYLLYHESWVFGLTLCRVFTFAMSSSIYISTFTMTAIALVRYQLVIYPHRNWASTCAVSLITVSIWCMGIVMTLPYLMHVDLVPQEDCGIKFCNEKWDDQSHRIKFSWITLICQFLLPFLTVSFLYFAVYRKLRDRQQMQNRQQVARRLEQAKKVGAASIVKQPGRRLYLHHQRGLRRHHHHHQDPHSAIELGSLDQLHSGSLVGQPALTGQTSLAATGATGGGRASSAEELAQADIKPGSAVAAPSRQQQGVAAAAAAGPRLSSASVNVVNGGGRNETSTCLLADYSDDDEGGEGDIELARTKADPQQRRRPASSMGFLNHTDDDGPKEETGAGFVIEQDGQTDIAVTVGGARGQNKQRLEQVSQRADDILAIRERRINERNRRLNQTNRKLVFMVSLFACSWMPLNVFNLIVDYMESIEYIKDEWSYVKHIFLTVHLIACSSVCYNPILYAWMSDNYRQELRNILPAPLLRKLNFLIGAR